jgi:hypothetical protein
MAQFGDFGVEVTDLVFGRHAASIC